MDKKIAVVGYSLSGSTAAKQALMKHDIEVTTMDDFIEPVKLEINQDDIIEFAPKYFPKQGSKYHK